MLIRTSFLIQNIDRVATTSERIEAANTTAQPKQLGRASVCWGWTGGGWINTLQWSQSTVVFCIHCTKLPWWQDPILDPGPRGTSSQYHCVNRSHQKWHLLVSMQKLTLSKKNVLHIFLFYLVLNVLALKANRNQFDIKTWPQVLRSKCKHLYLLLFYLIVFLSN